MPSRIVILTRASLRTVLERRYGSIGQARFAMQLSPQGTADFARAEREDAALDAALIAIRRSLPDDVKSICIDRELLAQFLFEPSDLVVAVGPDGLVANAGKYLDAQLLAGVNPDPGAIEGSLLPFTVDSFVAALPDALADRRPFRKVTLAEAVTADAQVLRGSTRYLWVFLHINQLATACASATPTNCNRQAGNTNSCWL